jgi:hypothetical protein
VVRAKVVPNEEIFDVFFWDKVELSDRYQGTIDCLGITRHFDICTWQMKDNLESIDHSPNVLK